MLGEAVLFPCEICPRPRFSQGVIVLLQDARTVIQGTAVANVWFYPDWGAVFVQNAAPILRGTITFSRYRKAVEAAFHSVLASRRCSASLMGKENG